MSEQWLFLSIFQIEALSHTHQSTQKFDIETNEVRWTLKSITF